MLYLDSSIIVAALTAEEHTERAQRWLEERREQGLLLSAWTHVEVAAAFAAKQRAGQLKPAWRSGAVAAYEKLRADQASEVIPAASHFERAAAIAANLGAAVRGGDALHLAITSEEEATLCTLDKRQAEAGRALGLATILV